MKLTLIRRKPLRSTVTGSPSSEKSTHPTASGPPRSSGDLEAVLGPSSNSMDPSFERAGRTDPRSGTKNRFPRLTANLQRRTSYFALSSVQRLLASGKRLFSANGNRLAVNQFLLLLRTCNHQPPTPAFFTTHNL